MSQYNIAVIVGSLRQNSINRILAEALTKLAPPELKLTQVSVGNLPLYNQDDDSAPAEEVKKFKAEISAAQGVIFITPEYNRSIPGVLKNALDHASRPYGQSVWKGKPAGVLGASIGSNGTAMAQQHLRNVLAYLDMPTLNQPEAFVHIKDEATASPDSVIQNSQQQLERWLAAYLELVKTTPS